MKPILFNTEQVRNILERRKTSTRRPIKPQPIWIGEPNVPFKTKDADPKGIINNPYKVGDILYVRETWAIAATSISLLASRHFANIATSTCSFIEECQSCLSGLTHSVEHCQCHYVYKADGDKHIKWHPSIHMPKEAARIFLKVKNVRVERLQDMTHEDCRKEGSLPVSWIDEKDVFKVYWNEIYAKRGYSWEANPWVWVYEFEWMKEGI